MTTDTKAAMWTSDASKLGKAAYLEAERQQRLRRSPAERAREPLPVELAHLAELDAEAEIAGANRQAAALTVFEAMPRPDDPNAAQRRYSATEISDARAGLVRADQLELIARVKATNYRLAMSAAGTARSLKITTKGDAR